MFFKEINDALKGRPDKVITILLFVVALVAVSVALFGSPVHKAAFLAWFVAP